MKNIITTVLLFSCAGCSTIIESPTPPTAEKDTAEQTAASMSPVCPGDIELPAELQGQFIAAEDQELLQRSIGKEDAGKLCQAKVYQAKENAQITIYRSWNSTNPNSQMGNWWAAKQPQGRVADYRVDYEICYQWSPLDMMTQCTLKPGTKVVIGTGQSALCSEYLTYPASAKKQIYIEAANEVVSDCNVYNAKFTWQEASAK